MKFNINKKFFDFYPKYIKYIFFSFLLFASIIIIIFCYFPQKIDGHIGSSKKINLKKIILELPKDSEIICLNKTEYPKNLNPTYNINYVPQFLRYLKTDFIEDVCCNNNLFTLKIKNNLKFINGEIINAESIKYTLKKYIDADAGKFLFDLFNKEKLSSYIMETNPRRKENKFNDIFVLDREDPLKISFYKEPNINITEEQIKIFCNGKITILPSRYINEKIEKKNKISSKKLIDLYAKKILSYGEYYIKEFDNKKLWMQKHNIINNDKNNNIIFLYANKREQHELFKNDKISSFVPLEDIEEEEEVIAKVLLKKKNVISYDDQALNRCFLNNEKYSIETEPTELNLFLGFNLTEKLNCLKENIKMQMDYFLEYYAQKNDILKIEFIHKTNNIINSLNDIDQIYQEYEKFLRQLNLDSKALGINIKKLKKWYNCYLPNKICLDEDFRKAFYFAFDRKKIIQDILPFYKESFYPISELSKFHYSQNKDFFTTENLDNFLDINNDVSDKNYLDKSFNKAKAKELFHKSLEKLSLENDLPIELKVKFNYLDKRSQIIFDYLEKTILDVFEHQIILKKYNKNNIMERNNFLQDNVVDSHSDFINEYYNNCDLYIDFINSDNFNNFIFSYLTNFDCNHYFEIDLKEELNKLSAINKDWINFLQQDFEYVNKKISGLNKDLCFKGDIWSLNNFFINKFKMNWHLLTKEQQKIAFILLKSLEKKYFQNCPLIPLCSVQKCTIKRN